jgi:hypothetical protein
MITSKRISPPYSILFISDSNRPDSPEPDERLISWNDSCITVRCLYEHDGDTTVSLGRTSELARSGVPALTTVLKEKVGSARTRVRIWTNDPVEPDEIVIGLG